MRIISGRFRGKKIEAPAYLPVRPTTDFAKTGLFNILSHKINLNDIHILDLYAGTGNMTYEFLSRGAKHVTAVDNNKSCTAFISSTLQKLKITNARVITSDALLYLANCKESYDIIFADPPYHSSPVNEIANAVMQYGLLLPDGLLIIEHSSDLHSTENAYLLETRRYGAVAFSIFVADKK